MSVQASGENMIFQRKFRNRRIENATYVPDIPRHLPHAHIYTDGEDGISNRWRIKEHEGRSAIWKHLVSLSPTVSHALILTQDYH